LDSAATELLSATRPTASSGAPLEASRSASAVAPLQKAPGRAHVPNASTEPGGTTMLSAPPPTAVSASAPHVAAGTKLPSTRANGAHQPCGADAACARSDSVSLQARAHGSSESSSSSSGSSGALRCRTAAGCDIRARANLAPKAARTGAVESTSHARGAAGAGATWRGVTCATAWSARGVASSAQRLHVPRSCMEAPAQHKTAYLQQALHTMRTNCA
jgi:hypothetical protein